MEDNLVESAAEALWSAEFLVIALGSQFPSSSGSSPCTSSLCDIGLLSNVNKFVGFWGQQYNLCMDRPPNEGYKTLAKWRERYFSVHDDRKRKGNKVQTNKDDENSTSTITRCMIVTTCCDNSFQRCEVPEEEVYEVWGNITLFQCSANPPCHNRVWKVQDSNFRFMVDLTTMEAPPIKYESHRKETRPLTGLSLLDLETDVGATSYLPFRDSHMLSQAADVKKNLLAHKRPYAGRELVLKSLNEPYQLWERATPIYFNKLCIPKAAGKYHDLFFCVPREVMRTSSTLFSRKDSGPHEHLDATVNLSVHSSSNTPRESICAFSVESNQCEKPSTWSHFYHHTQELWANRHPHSEGKFRLYDAELLRQEWYTYCRSSHNHTSNAPNYTSTHIADHRTYNISVAVRKCKFASTDRDDTTKLESGGFPRYSTSETYYPSDPGSWTQGKDGYFYFPGVSLQRSQGNDPNSDIGLDYDEILIPLTSENCRLPTRCILSVICESRSIEGEPTFPTNTACQLFGSISINEEESNYLSAMLHTINIESKKDEKKPRALELTLLSRFHYNVYLGVEPVHTTVTDKSHTSSRDVELAWKYLRITLPRKDPSQSLSFPFVEHQNESAIQWKPSQRAQTFPPLGDGEFEVLRKPIPNHLVCPQCHGVARPFVLMSNGKKKDDGILQSVLSAKQKQFKVWESEVTQIVKNDSNRSLVILEIGCDSKGDPVKAVSDRMFKNVKSSKNTLIRIGMKLSDAKAKSSSDANNVHLLEGDVIQILKNIDACIQNKRRGF